jgi:hypothetical protein
MPLSEWDHFQKGAAKNKCHVWAHCKHCLKAEIKAVRWVNLRCYIDTNDLPDGYIVDIRAKYNDSKTTIVNSKNKLLKDVFQRLFGLLITYDKKSIDNISFFGIKNQ